MPDEIPSDGSGDDDSGSGGEILSAIPEVYFDILARIVPGAIMVWLVKPGILSETHTSIFVLFVSLAAYLLGSVLHIASDLLWAWPLLRLRRIDVLRLHGDHEIWMWIRSDLRHHGRTLYTKMMAEKTMFRTLSLVAILGGFCHLDLFDRYPRWLVAGGAFLTCSFCMLVVSRWIGVAVDESRRKQPIGGR